MICLFAASVLSFSKSNLLADDFEFFEKQVRPILVNKCFKCHSGEKSGGGLSLESKSGWQKGGENGPAVVPRDINKSLLIQAINYQDLEMPPKDEGGKLSDQEIKVLTEWVKNGALDPRTETEKIGGMTLEKAKFWWSFQPLPETEKIVADELADKIDEYLNSEIDKRQLEKTSKADKRTLIRRATYDLTGLPPTENAVKEFQDDDSFNAFDKVIDRLLNSKQYGVKWGRNWLDVVRYADTAGENSDRPLPHAWRYRNWVINSFNQDMSFDEFSRWQIAGDLINKTRNDEKFSDGLIATGYLAIARRFGHDIDKDIHLMYDDVIDNLGKNFLGLTIGCARCHDHKYDPISAKDYYALYGIFASTQFSFPGCEPKPLPRDLIPLLPKSKADIVEAEYKKRLAIWEKQRPDDPEKTKQLKEIGSKHMSVLAAGKVAEASSIPLETVNQSGQLDKIKVNKGEVIQLAIYPNANHGADTTTIDFRIIRDSDKEVWDVADLIPIFMKDGPMISVNGATWCLIESTNGPVFLREPVKVVDGAHGLSAWTIGSVPSITVNANDHPVNVWTTLPKKTFFMHPAHNRPVAICWVCPKEGEYSIRGKISDGHPAPSLDGVSFKIAKFTSADFGNGLIELGKRALNRTPKPEPPTYPVAYAVRESNPVNESLHLRGDPEQKGEPVPRRWLNVFGGDKVNESHGSGRLQLADWVVKQPLFARVLANRIWQWHFGKGIVGTANNFGARGTEPTHQKLLDLLASHLVANNFKMKPIHRAIMKTAAYQRSSFADAKMTDKDPENKWLARFSSRRLSAEEIRDSLLFASKSLDLTFGKQHPFPPEKGWAFTQHAPFSAVYDSNKRSAFLMVQRQRRHPYLALFDGADPNSSTPNRKATTVPTQALYFMNDPFFHSQASLLINSIPKNFREDEMTQAIFRRLLQRRPNKTEVGIARDLMKNFPGESSEKMASYARILMASNEFLFID